MTQEELDKAVNKLISEANEESAAAKAEYEKQCLDAKNGAIERRVLRSGILQDALAERKEAYDALVRKFQKELDESLEALDAEGAAGPPGEDTGDAPYEVDYTLPMRDRYVAVKNYYLGYDDIAQALEDYLEDETAQAYLGDYYDYLLQLLLLMQE